MNRREAWNGQTSSSRSRKTWARSGKLRERLTISVTEPAVFPHLPVQVPDFLIVPLLVLMLARADHT